MSRKRLERHTATDKLEELLKEVNGLLGPVEADTVTAFEKNRYPIVMVVGSPRSGTTLMMQWLASTGCFAYPTNLLSRFYGAPYIGAKIQLMLTRYDFRNEIFDFNEEVPFSSELGKTRGALAPNEFWYFWRRFFNFGEIQRLDDEELKGVDAKGFVSELAALEAAFELPLAMKAMIINWNIPFIADVLDKVLFIYIKRHPLYNSQSLHGSRENYFGDRSAWYSFKPPEYETLKDLDPCEQVAGQVYYTNRAVEDGLSGLDPSKVINVKYEDFCHAPGSVFEEIKDRFRRQGCEADWEYDGPDSFTAANRVTLSGEEVEKIIAAYERFSGERIEP